MLNYFFCKAKSVFDGVSIDVIEFILGTKNFAILYDGVSIAEKIGLKGGHLSTIFLCTLQRPYKTPSLEPAALIILCCSTLRAPDDFKDFKEYVLQEQSQLLQLYDQDVAIKFLKW